MFGPGLPALTVILLDKSTRKPIKDQSSNWLKAYREQLKEKSNSSSKAMMQTVVHTCLS